MTVLQRHTRVWPSAGGYASLASQCRDSTARAALELWSARGWPLVVRRADDDDLRSGDTIAVGLALPPSLGKQRLKFQLIRDDVAMHAAPLTLDDVIGSVPDPRFQRTLMPLVRAAAREHRALRLFGSAAWQAQTGLDYMHVDSDLDLLAEPSTRQGLDSAIAFLARAERDIAMRLDGEIVFPGGDAVAWREWREAKDANRVIAKNVAGVALVSRNDLLKRFDRRKLAA
jgi:phosphoribosyl-dephospho-CoA transferase